MNYHNDENKPVRMFVNLTSERVNHYNDVIEFMVQTEVSRCRTEDKFEPTQSQIQFLRKELLRHVTIRRNIEFAQKIKIPKSRVL